MIQKLQGLADRVSWQDITRGMSAREMADRFGVSLRTAQRARAGRTTNPKFTQTQQFRNRRAARAFRRLASRTIRVGKTAVYYINAKGRRVDQGYRNIPAVDLSDPEAIASAIADGEYQEALYELESQIMSAYGAGEEGEDPYISIADWPEDLFDE